ncbi:amino acid permease [Ancylomarina euxinus]|uniref:Amino acid permease n=1 Tax=Ancylomarina euxinus TaxID=2283627 RepID=A0A425Y3F5_9BACT|nr:amino acid permease [Ancylomarina euxinus]MCZ4693192.1 amino acid permease [Ancylomarina euxinus]MUP15329.1 amino acid permease [Ancylomarina euxinus]RRG22544.1 amino acid permease [Ancylomarina euxinus]
MQEGLEKRKFGTAPVFFTAISTILGAVLFLRFGYAVGNLGFWGVILIILLGHLVTIPTAFAISELATNKRVEGGGEYFIISRSFGLNIGATIGLALFFSQAISVAFYVIAFTEAFEPVFNWVLSTYDLSLPRQVVSVPAMLILSALILKKGANLGVKALYFVAAILFGSLLLFFLGDTAHASGSDFSLFKAEFRNADQFYVIFAIIFPAFTGMTAGVGLSGDLKNPAKSIPWGTTAATFIGMIIYVLVVYKLAQYASVQDLLDNQLIMGQIALGGAIAIPLGLAASTISSALGSVMVAPRTLQALSVDRSLPSKGLNKWLAKGRQNDGEPINASIVTCLIALFFVFLGDINAVAEIISMFFMVTYGALCLISFLNHFGSSPSYRPSFKSKWFLSLLGFIVSVLVMFKINTIYALLAIMLMVLTYLYMNYYHKDRHGLASIFLNSLYQLHRNVQVFLQKAGKKRVQEWRPSAICISKDSFERDTAFKLLNWIAYKYGFGTYLHRIEGYYSRATHEKAKQELDLLVSRSENVGNHVFVDTIISPSYTSAIAQAIQLPGVAGMENNMVIFEYDKENAENLGEIIDNYALANAGNFDFCVLASSHRRFKLKSDIHIWIKPSDADNANLMILLSFIIAGHPDWKKADIKIFNICKAEQAQEVRESLDEMIASGRLPIISTNVEVLIAQEDVSPKDLINERSEHAGLTLIGFRGDIIKHEGAEMFKGYESLGHILFVNANTKKEIE